MACMGVIRLCVVLLPKIHRIMEKKNNIWWRYILISAGGGGAAAALIVGRIVELVHNSILFRMP